MKKGILGFVLALIICFGAKPATAFAAGTIEVTAQYSTTYNAAGVVDATWNSVSGATTYEYTLMNTDPSGNWLQCGGFTTRKISAGSTLACSIGGVFLEYGNGGSKYKISVSALDSNGELLAHGYSNEFTPGFPMLAAPSSVTLSEDGKVSCTSVSGATSYYFFLIDPSGYTIYASKETADTSCDFGAYLVSGTKYKAAVCVYSNTCQYRMSGKAYSSNTITGKSREKSSITGIVWDATSLKWDAYQGATAYYLNLLYYSNGSYSQVGYRQNTTSTSFDFYDYMNLFGNGDYKVNIVAVVGNEDNEISLDTCSSPHSFERIIPSNEVTISFDANGGTGSMASVTITEGTKYELPKTCDYMPPAGKKFKTWEIVGWPNTYAPGSSWTFSSDTVIKAIWEDDGSSSSGFNTNVIIKYVTYVEASDDNGNLYVGGQVSVKTQLFSNSGYWSDSGYGYSAEEGTTVEIKAQPKEGYSFVEWRRNGTLFTTSAEYSFTANDNYALTAVFRENTPEYSIYVEACDTNGNEYKGGEVSLYTGSHPDSGYFTATGYGLGVQADARLTIKARPYDGYDFVEWRKNSPNGELFSTYAECLFVAFQDIDLYAIFREKSSSCTLVTGVNGEHGSISEGKAGIEMNATETVIFIPDEGYELARVTVNGVETGVLSNVLDVLMDSDKTVIAEFRPIVETYSIHVTAYDNMGNAYSGGEVSLYTQLYPESGYWEESGYGFSAQADTMVQISARPFEGYSFLEWRKDSPTGEVFTNSSALSFVADENLDLYAIFKVKGFIYKLTTSVVGGHGTISESKTDLEIGSVETVIFSPEEGYELAGVTVNGVETGVLSNVLDVTMDSDKEVTAEFRKIEVKTTAPTSEPTTAPTSKPTTAPTSEPTTTPTSEPTAEPSEAVNPTEAVKSNEAGMPVETPNSGSNATTSAKDKGGSHAMLWTAISVTLAGAITGTLVCVRKRRRQMK